MNGPDFGRVFLMLNYNEKPQNTYIQSWTVSEIMASEVRNFDSCYTLTDYQIHWNWQEYVISVMLISVHNIKITCEWHKTIKLNYKNTRTRVSWPLTSNHYTLLETGPLSRSLVLHLTITQEFSSSRGGVWCRRQVQYADTKEVHSFLWPISP